MITGYDYLEDIIELKVKQFENRLKSATNGIEGETRPSMLQANGQTIMECGVALELLSQVKVMIKQARNFDQ